MARKWSAIAIDTRAGDASIMIRTIRYRTHRRIEPFASGPSSLPIVADAGILSLGEYQQHQIERALPGCKIEDADDFDAACMLAGDGTALIFADDLWLTAECVGVIVMYAQTDRSDSRAYRAALPHAMALVRDFIAPLCELPTADLQGHPHCLLPLHLLRGGAAASCSQSTISRSKIVPLCTEADESHCDHLSLPPIGESADRRFEYFRTQIPAFIDFPPLRISTARAVALPIRHWSHLLTANLAFGIYADMLRLAQGAEPAIFRHQDETNTAATDSAPDVRQLIIIGRDVRIDPTATIIGPTVIGDGVVIEAGACVSAAIIGPGCIVGQGAQIRLSVLGEFTILPPGANLVLWTVCFGRSLINSPVRYSVIGSDCFLSAQVSITDRVLDDGPDSARYSFGGRQVRVRTATGLMPSGYWFLGAAIGCHSRVGAGLQFYPGRALPAHSRVYAHNVRPDFALDPARSVLHASLHQAQIERPGMHEPAQTTTGLHALHGEARKRSHPQAESLAI
jgi:UDP-N-acetylglucosamine diphosphorylase / glucose-1-phosphate thymidylyltransferase / UDP-N-acetylgalactosamine diphosphorylase / glucosamine-1-phosphate N-acetyltransferase / galactosamine-1-phosphate N-acetyltransferase